MVDHEYALDVNNDPIHIENAIPSQRMMYFCPECHAEMVVKNQGQIQEHHFAHYNGTGGEGESPAHSDTTMFLLELFRQYIKEGKKFKSLKRCSSPRIMNKIEYKIDQFGVINCLKELGETFSPCYETIKTQDEKFKLRTEAFNYHQKQTYQYYSYSFYYDILKNVDQVEREYTIPGSLWRPDLALLNNGKVIRVIEVVYTHEDDPEKTKYYQKNKIDVVTVKLTQKPDAFFDLRKKWVSNGVIDTTIYRYTPCNYILNASAIIENWNLRKDIDKISYLLWECRRISEEFVKIKIDYTKLDQDYKILFKDIDAEIIEHKKYLNQIQTYADEFKYEAEVLKGKYSSLLDEYTELHNDILLSISQVKEDSNFKGTTFLYSIDKNYVNSHLLSRIRKLCRSGLREIREGTNGMLDVYEIAASQKQSTKGVD